MSRITPSYSSAGIWAVSHRRPHDGHVHASPYGIRSTVPQSHVTVIGGPFTEAMVHTLLHMSWRMSSGATGPGLPTPRGPCYTRESGPTADARGARGGVKWLTRSLSRR